MRILALDQSRNGAWSVFEYPSGELVAYDSYSFDVSQYTYAQAIMQIESLVAELMEKHQVSAVFMEDIQLRANAKVFKKLAQLQGVLINFCEKNSLLYSCIPPKQWQSYCEKKLDKAPESNADGKKASKVLSIGFVKSQFHIETDNDNIADAICIGYYVCEKVKIHTQN